MVHLIDEYNCEEKVEQFCNLCPLQLRMSSYWEEKYSGITHHHHLSKPTLRMSSYKDQKDSDTTYKNNILVLKIFGIKKYFGTKQYSDIRFVGIKSGKK